MFRRFNIAKKPISDGSKPVTFAKGALTFGSGAVMLSRGVDRRTYIENCYLDKKITIKSQNGEVFKDCVVSKHIWNDIVFPKSFRDLGSQVFWVSSPLDGRRVVIAVISKKDEKLQLIQDQSIIGRVGELSSAYSKYDADEGFMKTFIESQGEGGGVFWYIKNADELGLFRIYIQGQIEFEAEKYIKYTAREQFNIYVGDDQDFSIINVDKDGFWLVDLYGNKITTNEDGIQVEDLFNNKVVTTEDGIAVEDTNGNKITLNKDGIKQQVNSSSNIKMLGEGGTEDTALLFNPTNQVFTDLINNCVELCTYCSSLTVLYPAGVLNPNSILNFQLSANKFSQISTKLNDMKSKHVKLT